MDTPAGNTYSWAARRKRSCDARNARCWSCRRIRPAERSAPLKSQPPHSPKLRGFHPSNYAEAEPPLARRARAYIADHHADPLTLGQLAAALHFSPFYFCKLFRKATGLTFTDYLGRVRVEKARSLLINPNLRVSEIAYQVGFQSLTHFNRVFLRLVGVSPTAYRESLPAARRNSAVAA